MSSYTIKSGDNLWNICKRQFGLTNSADIAKKVNEVVKANNIKDKNLIFAGQKIDLDMGLVIEREKSQDNTPIEKTQAQKAAQERATQHLTSTDIENPQVSIYGSSKLTNEQKEIAYKEYSQALLDTMDDGDGKVTVEEFKKSVQTNILEKEMNTLLRMTEQDEQQISVYDKNNDGHITASEYIEEAKNRKESIIKKIESMPELLQQYDSDKDGKISDAEYKISFGGTGLEDIEETSQRKANIFAENLDLNQDGIIDAKEFAFFNKYADTADGKNDGIIDNASEVAMFGSVTGKNADNAEYNRVINKYFNGEVLTDSEKATLNESQNTIRNAMNKAAGF